jgi:peptidoglycan/xylan/chitin deacetylase (PgdA/CDA1 family)
MTTDSHAVCMTIDVEADCPPYLMTCRGIEEGLDRVLALFAEESIRATFFVTGRVAISYPAMIRKIVSLGHELGSHGLNHLAFDTMDERTAAHEIRSSMEILQSFYPLHSFRAPYLRFPDSYLGLLVDAGFTIDSSQAKYKLAYYHKKPGTSLTRVPVSMTSSVLRLPDWIRLPVLKALSSPIVLFVHPWEFVDLTQERLRLDCRFRTGLPAVGCLKSVIGFFRAKNARFCTIRELETHGDSFNQ